MNNRKIGTRITADSQRTYWLSMALSKRREPEIELGTSNGTADALDNDFTNA